MIDYAHTFPIRPPGENHTLTEVVSNSSSRETTVSSAKATSGFNKKKIGTFIFFVIVGGVVAIGVKNIFLQKSSTVTGNTSGSQLGVQSPEANTVEVNRDFSFKAYDKSKKLADPLKYTVTTAQLTKQIIIKGQKATAVVGRTFLILNLKLSNETEKSLYLNSRNYIRVRPAGGSDKLAPEIHNDTVEIQPLSTKLTRIGLPVDDNQKEFTLFIGEIEGKKEEVPLKFNK